MILSVAMILSISVTAFATDQRQRVEIIIESEADIEVFYHSSEYDPSIFYSFIMTNQNQYRILCPSCGQNNYRGKTSHDEMDIFTRMCPSAPDLGSDVCTKFHVYSYSECDYCGYCTSKTFVNKYWLVVCHVEMPDGWGSFIARPGQSYLNGYDLHEDPVYMNLH